MATKKTTTKTTKNDTDTVKESNVKTKDKTTKEEELKIENVTIGYAKNSDKDKIVDETELEVAELKKQIEEQQSIIKNMMDKMSEMTKAMSENNSTPNIQIVKDTSSQNRKVKVISCIDCFLNLTTEPKGGGIKYEFPRFGTSHSIKMENLEKCVHEHRNSFLRGDCYICDPEAVAELGLSEAYEHLYNAQELNDIIMLRHGEVDVEKIYGMGVYDEFSHELIDDTSRKNAIDAIAMNLAKGVEYDRNLIYMLNRKLNIDLDEMASKAKEVIDKGKN